MMLPYKSCQQVLLYPLFCCCIREPSGFPCKPPPLEPCWFPAHGSRATAAMPWRVMTLSRTCGRLGGNEGHRRPALCRSVGSPPRGSFWGGGRHFLGEQRRFCWYNAFYLSFYYGLPVHQKLYQQFPKWQFPLWLELMKFNVIYR